MKILRTKDGWAMSGKVVNALDKFVLDCVRVVSRFTNYVLVSGYVSILVGRSRVTEDVDMLIGPLGLAAFKKFHKAAIKAGFEFINPEDATGLHEMLAEGTSIRMARAGKIIPNLEIKYVHDERAKAAMADKERFSLNGKDLYLSPFELQIPYKIHLGSDKDIEDARYLWELLGDKLDAKKLRRYMKLMHVEGRIYGIG